jgi:hypothetical protein
MTSCLKGNTTCDKVFFYAYGIGYCLDSFFSQNNDVLQLNGPLPLHECIIIIHIMVYGCVANACDEYF